MKWILIGTFTFLIIALIVHIVMHGVRMTGPDESKPLFRAPTKEEMRSELKWDLIIGTIFILLVYLWERGG